MSDQERIGPIVIAWDIEKGDTVIMVSEVVFDFEQEYGEVELRSI